MRSAWTVDDCFQGRKFDFTKNFLPERITGLGAIACLNRDEKRMLNHIRGNSYCHIFAFVEEYIIPMVLDHARRDVFGNESRLRYLLQFAEQETKHQDMLRRAMDQISDHYGVAFAVIPGREDVAQVVLGKSPLAALLLTSMIEWFTQMHYLEHVKSSAELDILFRDILRYHWIDEAQHAKADSLLIDEIAADLTPVQCEQAVDELLELGGAIDRMLAQQVEMDIECLEILTGRQFTGKERSEITLHQHRSYRWTFITSGLEHPHFKRIVEELSGPGSDKMAQTAMALMAA